MRITAIITATLGGITLLSGVARADVVLMATNNATVQPSGPRTGTNGLRFLNIEGSANSSFSSYGVIDFAVPSAASGGGVTGLTLALTQNNASFTSNGALRFYVSEDTTTSISQSVSPLVFRSSSLPGGVGAQLSPLLLLGTGAFTQVANGHEDGYTFAVSGSLATYLTAQANARGDVRIVVAPDDATVAATYSGFSNTGAQVLTLATTPVVPSVPEPMSLALLVPALGLLAARRRRSG